MALIIRNKEMNELEKLPSSEATLPEADAATANQPQTADCVNNGEICSENESPAMSMAEAADAAVSGATANADSTEMADRTETEPEAEDKSAEGEDAGLNAPARESFKRFYAMTKDQLLQMIREILDNNEMNSHKEVAAIKQAYFSICNKDAEEELAAFVDAGNSPEDFTAQSDERDARMKDLLADFKARRAAYLEEDERKRQENLELKNKIIEQLCGLVEDIDNINLHFPKFQQLQQDFKSIKEIPAGAEAETWKNYQIAVEQFYDRLKMNKELRDLDFKKNLETKRQLIEEARKLETVNDVVAAFRQLQDLHLQWREIGPVAKEYRESVWDEFKAASTVINKRHQDFFLQRKEEEQAAEAAKTALCEEIEALDWSGISSYSDWTEMTNRIIALQERWKPIGFASRKVNNQLYARFRKVCDDFFSAKNEYYRKAKDDQAANLARKTSLCEQAEALKDENPELRQTIQKVVALQEEWKKTGSVARRYSDAIWKRFSEACNLVFDAHRKATSEQRKAENANLAKKRDIIARIKELPTDGDRKEVMDSLRELQDEWRNTGHVPFKTKEKLYEEYREAVDAVYNAYNVRESRARMNKFASQIDNMKGDGNKLGKERDRLMRALEGKRSELMTYENNMGFFNVKSSAGNSMLQDLERRIGKIKEEMATIESKIALLDQKASEE